MTVAGALAPTRRVARPAAFIAPRRLHLGCGKRHIPGYHHIDILEFPHVDTIGPVEWLGHIRSDCAETIYACHVLEHFGRYEVFDVVSEWFRVLRPGGILRVAVPDFEAAARYHVAHGDIRDVLGLLMGGQTTAFDYHRVIFDQTSLGELLEDVGFRHIRRYDWRATDHAWLDDFSQAYLPHLDKERGTLVSLNVEAEK